MLKRRTVKTLTCWLSWVSVDFLSAVKPNEVPGCKSSDWLGTDDAWFYRGRDYTHTRRIKWGRNDWCCTIKTQQKLSFLCSLTVTNYRWIHTCLHIQTHIICMCNFHHTIHKHNKHFFLSFKLVLIVLHVEHVLWYIKYRYLAVNLMYRMSFKRSLCPRF